MLMTSYLIEQTYRRRKSREQQNEARKAEKRLKHTHTHDAFNISQSVRMRTYVAHVSIYNPNESPKNKRDDYNE